MGSQRWSSWAYRHVLVRAGKVTYYKSEFDAKPQGSVALLDIRRVGVATLAAAGGRQHAIELSLAAGKTLQLGFRDTHERDTWLSLLLAVRHANERGM